MADFCMVMGLILGAFGLFLIAGSGWACLSVGLVLFVAGGLDRVKR